MQNIHINIPNQAAAVADDDAGIGTSKLLR
jgi:hypothetical protein